MKKLPINDVIPKIQETLKNTNKLILEAPAGAGKSTMVPISLLDELWLKDKIIIMLEPRRVAARAVAFQMAKLLGQKIGQTVGYQVKMDSCFSKDTKILVVTEGILTRKLQSDQALENVAMIIFDEFHERSIHTDLSLALSLQSQELLRDDLKILLMSATLNSSKIASLLGDVEVIKSKGRMFDIEDIYLKEDIKHPTQEALNDILLSLILKSIKEDEGDILVFLAGMKEIRNISEKLNYKLSNTNIEILPLHSNLTKEEQDKAINKSINRKVILSTNIAQTSLTIEGIKVVIDSGLEKQIRFNPSNDMNHLEYTFISKQSAIQRAGRAGRLSSGKCYKLWHKNRILKESSKPEILRADLSSFLLDVTLWGVEDLSELKLLDIPSDEIIDSSKQLLKDIDMLDAKGNITRYGKQSLSLGIHPRFANMIFKANDLGFAKDACLLASLLLENDIFKNSFSSCDLYERYLILKEKSFNNEFINKYRAKQVLDQSTYLYNKLERTIDITKIAKNNIKLEKEMLGVLLLYAYPNRLAKLREKNDNKYKLSNEKGALLNNKDMLFNSEYLVVPRINAKELNSHIIHACSISLEYIKKYFSSYLRQIDLVTYKKERNSLDIKTATYFFKLELYSNPNLKIKKEKYPLLLIDLIKKEGLELLSWSKKAQDLISKVCFINYHIKNEEQKNTVDIKLPDFTQNGLLKDIKNIEPFLQNITSVKQLKNVDTYSYLTSLIPWNDLQTIEKLLPNSIKVPSGSNIKIDYSDIKIPILKVKIQEIFGLKQTPKILNNTLALQIHLLSPAQRPIQITYDLESFWKNSYVEVRKELRGKYKKHYWPENPYKAIATNKLKRNM
ncbi:ATP-dependent helicase HrpB [Poseidonibacter antarcticus]|uniref:ATP-dependent helicase HrpB n=1 Tax=Poseidonibacter antarcticus TaxID=2478538 RepID=UPI000EF44F35|nr:ATP-dependent helicase HrpB [Poseidonibacter antarcticus]